MAHLEFLLKETSEKRKFPWNILLKCRNIKVYISSRNIVNRELITGSVCEHVAKLFCFLKIMDHIGIKAKADGRVIFY